MEGAPPADVARRTNTLLELALAADANTIIVDSLKDAALGLTEDEVGAGYNRARQLALRDGVQLVELHHVVKHGPGGAQPTALADVYGSTWITAGAGSVVLLWGAAGDPLVEWRHLKQPASEVGPMQLVHDHDAGRTDVWRGTDLVDIAVAAGPSGLTITAAASALFQTDKPTAAQHAKAARRLDALVRRGKLVLGDAVTKPGGGRAEKVYHTAGRGGLVTNHGAITGHPVQSGNHGAHEQSRGLPSPQVKAITAPITAITAHEQSRTGPPLEGAVQLPDDEIVAPTCIDCGWRIDTVAHETTCEEVA